MSIEYIHFWFWFWWSFPPRVTNYLALSSLPMYQPSTPLLVLLQYCIRPCKLSCYSNLHTFIAWHILCSHNRNHWITALLKCIVHCILLYSLGFHIAIRSQRHASSQWRIGRPYRLNPPHFSKYILPKYCFCSSHYLFALIFVSYTFVQFFHWIMFCCNTISARLIFIINLV